MLLEGIFFTFMANANDLIVSRFGYSPKGAGEYVALVYVVAALVGPLFGWCSDKYGKRIYMMTFGTIVITGANIFIILLKNGSHIR